MNKRGFTLIEIIAAIAIVAILALISIPNFIRLYQNSNEKAIKVQENQIVDASKLLIEDYCVHSIDGNSCGNNIGSVSGDSTLRYVCLNTLQSNGYIKNVTFKNQKCNGYVLFNKQSDSKNYSNYKAYIECGKAYQTKDYDTFVDDSDNLLIVNCDGKVVNTSEGSGQGNQPNNPPHHIDDEPQIIQPGVSLLMAGSNTDSDSSFLGTSISKYAIKKITFSNTLAGHTPNGTDCFDVSKNGDKSVLLWISKTIDYDGDNYYEVTIGANGKVYASKGEYLFCGLFNLESFEGMEYFDTSLVNNMSHMFDGCCYLKSIDLSHFNTSRVTNMSYMFAINVSSFKNVDIVYLDLSSFDTSKVKDFSYMISNLGGLKQITFGSKFDTSSATVMRSMFAGNNSLTSLDLFGFNTSNVEDMVSMFNGCSSLTSLDLSHFNTSKVTNMSYMFGACNSLKTLIFGDGFDTSNVISMLYMFSACRSLESLDLSKFDTRLVESMYGMFDRCTSLTSLNLGGSFSTAKVTTMKNMFYNCKSLETLNLSNFNTSLVTSMGSMFSDCSALKSIIGLNKFNTSNVLSMASMFNNCKSFEQLDLVNFNTQKVTDMSYMFYGCSLLNTLNIDSFNTSALKNTYQMFYNCSNLQSIYASKNFVVTNVTNSTKMFYNCSKLVGGMGTAYNSSYTDKTYARMDEGSSKPGYFSYAAS